MRMVRKQVYLTADQNQRLRQIASRQQKTEAAVIREAIDTVVAAPRERSSARKDALWDIVGLGRSGVGTLSEKVDHHLYGSRKVTVHGPKRDYEQFCALSRG